jgi:hypothetical protein
VGYISADGREPDREQRLADLAEGTAKRADHDPLHVAVPLATVISVIEAQVSRARSPARTSPAGSARRDVPDFDEALLRVMSRREASS